MACWVHHQRRPIFEDHSGAVTAVATVFIAAFTIVLASVTRRQAHLTRIAAEAAKRSALVAERALTELERPYLAVDVPVPGVSVDISGNFSFVEQARWVAINYGRTPALLIDRLTGWAIEAVSAMPCAIDPTTQRGPLFPAGCVSGADKPYEETANLMAEAPIQTMLDKDAWRNRRIFFCGYIRYADLIGGVYVHGFCLVFDPLGQRFVRIGGQTYNYTRTEKPPGTEGTKS